LECAYVLWRHHIFSRATKHLTVFPQKNITHTQTPENTHYQVRNLAPFKTLIERRWCVLQLDPPVACVSRYQRAAGWPTAGFPLCKQVVKRPQTKELTASSIFAHASDTAGTVRFNMKCIAPVSGQLHCHLAPTIWRYPGQYAETTIGRCIVSGHLAMITMGTRKNCPCA
jgi:hypothetical protein